jgi:hypothetical protein
MSKPHYNIWYLCIRQFKIWNWTVLLKRLELTKKKSFVWSCTDITNYRAKNKKQFCVMTDATAWFKIQGKYLYVNIHMRIVCLVLYSIWYDKQDQQGTAAFNEHELAEWSPGGPQTKTGEGTRQSTDRTNTKMILKRNNSNSQRN